PRHQAGVAPDVLVHVAHRGVHRADRVGELAEVALELASAADPAPRDLVDSLYFFGGAGHHAVDVERVERCDQLGHPVLELCHLCLLWVRTSLREVDELPYRTRSLDG